MLKAGRTQPPKRYTKATLLTQMEKHGLGTSATRADIIEKLVSSDTIERQGNLLHPTGKGKQLIGLVSPQLRTPDLTARWEAELEKIARGQGSSEPFLQGIRSMAQELVTGVKTNVAEYKPHNVSSSNCPNAEPGCWRRRVKRATRCAAGGPGPARQRPAGAAAARGASVSDIWQRSQSPATPPAPAPAPAAAAPPPPTPPAPPQPGSNGPARPTSPLGTADGPYVTPLVRKLAAEHGVDLATVAGTGSGGGSASRT